MKRSKISSSTFKKVKNELFQIKNKIEENNDRIDNLGFKKCEDLNPFLYISIFITPTEKINGTKLLYLL